VKPAAFSFLTDGILRQIQMIQKKGPFISFKNLICLEHSKLNKRYQKQSFGTQPVASLPLTAVNRRRWIFSL